MRTYDRNYNSRTYKQLLPTFHALDKNALDISVNYLVVHGNRALKKSRMHDLLPG